MQVALKILYAKSVNKINIPPYQFYNLIPQLSCAKSFRYRYMRCICER